MKNKNNKGGLLNATQQKLISNMTKKFMGSDVKLRLLPNSGIMINGLEFTFMGESIGKESNKGFAVSITGDEIDKDRTGVGQCPGLVKHTGVRFCDGL